MDASIYQKISYIGFGLAALFLIIAIVLFFVFDVIALYGEVSGKTADKRVREIREQNSQVNARRREVIRAGTSEQSSKQIAQEIFESQDTVVLQNQTEDTIVLNEGETMLLNEETTLLQENTGVVLLEDAVEIHTNEIIMEN